MKSASVTLTDKLKTGHNLVARPRLTAEWNLNRYQFVTASNSVGDHEPDVFPISSIVEPNRPTKGISKALVGHGRVSDEYQRSDEARFYIGSEDDKYKYWISPTRSDAAGNLYNAAPTIIYSDWVKSNKISIVLDNVWASPVSYTVYVFDRSSSWRPVATNAPIQNNGSIDLYWNGSNWTSTRPATVIAPIEILGVRMVVNRLGSGLDMKNLPSVYTVRGVYYGLTGGNAHLSVIEMAAKLEMDITDRLIKVEDTFDAGEVSILSPVGTITSNVGQLSLWNGDHYFSNSASPDLAGLIEPNVNMNLEYIYEINGQDFPVQQFNLFVDSWKAEEESTVAVQLSDASKFLKEVKPLPTMFEGQTFNQIMYRLCDSVGFTNYRVFDNVLTNDYEIPVFWTDGEKTLWELFDELSTATQSVIYFDSWGHLNVKTREDAYWSGAPVNWALRGQQTGSELANIESISESGEYESNVVRVRCKSVEWAKSDNGFVENSTVWAPDDTMMIRSAPLVASIWEDSNEFWIPAHEAVHWPFSGKVVIEDEVITYDAKKFRYFNGRGMVEAWVTDEAEWARLNAIAGTAGRHRNATPGSFRISERATWDTHKTSHRVDASGYAVKRFDFVNVVNSNAGWSHNKNSSNVNLNSSPYTKSHKFFLMGTRGSVNNVPWRHMGTSLKFNSGGNTHQRAGIVFNQQGGRDGYYVELTPTLSIPTDQYDTRKEIQFYAIKDNVISNSIPAIGIPFAIVEGIWYDIDIAYSPETQTMRLWVDGRMLLSAFVPPGAQVTPNGKLGIFARGDTNVDFEYLWGVNRPVYIPDDNNSSFHRIEGVSSGRKMSREMVNITKSLRRKNKKKRWPRSGQMFDEFGPYVHEIREYDVKFDPAPVKHSKIYMSNDWAVDEIEYIPSSFGAKFTLVNLSRKNETLSGEDSATFAGTGDSFSQHLTVYGQALVVEELEEIVVKNDLQVRARGEIEVEINSEWIQSKPAAQAVANWISQHWSNGVDVLDVTVFGNPLIEIGDLVSIDYPANKMYESQHHYFVTGTSTSFDGGLSTRLTLRRKS
jgi:hypothetical protein